MFGVKGHKGANADCSVGRWYLVKFRLLLFLPLATLTMMGMAQTRSSKGEQSGPQPFSLKDVVLTDSWVKEREQFDIRFIRNLDADRLLHNFRENAGLPSNAQPLGGWEAPYIGLRGHFVGHYLSVLSNIVYRYDDAELSQRLNYMIDELSRCQQSKGKGYLSAFPEKELETLETRFGGVWAPYYTLHKILQGLVDAYTLTGNKKAYDMALQLADYIDARMSRLSAETIQRMTDTRAANPPNETGAMNEVLYEIYGLTHNEKYLKLAHLFDPDWLATPLSEGVDILSGLHANTHIVLVNGFFCRYRLTGEQKYLDAAKNFWSILHRDHCYVNGSSSGPRPVATTPTSKTAEHWGDAGRLSNTLSTEIAESCVSHNTQKLSSYLFGATGDAVYAEAMMNTFWNAVMPIQSESTGDVVYHLPLGSPRTKKYLKPDDFFCCSGSSMEAFAKLNDGIYWHDNQTLWVNDYLPSTLKWTDRKFQIEQTSMFPKDSVITFHIVEANRRMPVSLQLLIPSWVEGGSVAVNGDALPLDLDGTSGYHTISRKWKKGDEVRLVLRGGFRIHHLAGDNQTVAISYGPMLLAFIDDNEVVLPCNETQLLQHLRADNMAEGLFSLTIGNRSYKLKPFFDIDRETYSVYVKIQS